MLGQWCVQRMRSILKSLLTSTACFIDRLVGLDNTSDLIVTYIHENCHYQEIIFDWNCVYLFSSNNKVYNWMTIGVQLANRDESDAVITLTTRRDSTGKHCSRVESSRVESEWIGRCDHTLTYEVFRQPCIWLASPISARADFDCQPKLVLIYQLQEGDTKV